ncbi:MAG: Tm-1-like ATP-binding domain-containing protein [Pirellulales bacterium]
MSVYLLATLDTKGTEARFVRDRLRELDVPVVLVDVSGRLGDTAADISRSALLEALPAAQRGLDVGASRGDAVALSAAAAAALVARDYATGKVTGVLGLGGSAGTVIGTAAMRSLPLGVPKLMVSTLASGQVRPYVADKDILMLNAVVDIAGLNRISRTVLSSAAAAMAGLVQHRRIEARRDDKPLVAATMFGVTTPCVDEARRVLEAAGYEVLVFHATGIGGQAMESLIAEGLVAGVLDITTTELADELVGGVLSAGPTRLTAAVQARIPQVVSVGALDMVNFGPRSTVPEKFAHRKFHQHNATITLMRTTAEENAALGAEIGRKLAGAGDLAEILLPAQGVSALDAAGQPFDDPAARQALFAGVQEHCGTVPCTVVDRHINDPEFARLAAEALLARLGQPAYAGRSP